MAGTPVSGTTPALPAPARQGGEPARLPQSVGLPPQLGRLRDEAELLPHPEHVPQAPRLHDLPSSHPRASASIADENGCARWYRLACAAADHGRCSSGVTNPHSSLTGASRGAIDCGNPQGGSTQTRILERRCLRCRAVRRNRKE